MARKLALAAGLLGLVLMAVLLLVPFATEERRLYGTMPQPGPVTAVALLELGAQQRACLDDAVVDPYSEVAQLRVGTYGRASQPLRLTLAGGGYRESVAIAAADYADNDLLEIPIDAPEQPTEVRICVTNEGDRRVAIYGTADRAKTRSTTRVDGVQQPANPTIVFAEAEPVSLADRAETILERIEVFRPGFLAPWMLWILLALVAAGVPAGAVLALDRALRDDARDARDTAPPDAAAPPAGDRPA